MINQIFIGFLVIELLGVAMLSYGLFTAVEGYQDERGFHEGIGIEGETQQIVAVVLRGSIDAPIMSEDAGVATMRVLSRAKDASASRSFVRKPSLGPALRQETVLRRRPRIPGFVQGVRVHEQQF